MEKEIIIQRFYLMLPSILTHLICIIWRYKPFEWFSDTRIMIRLNFPCLFCCQKQYHDDEHTVYEDYYCVRFVQPFPEFSFLCQFLIFGGSKVHNPKKDDCQEGFKEVVTLVKVNRWLNVIHILHFEWESLLPLALQQ